MARLALARRFGIRIGRFDGAGVNAELMKVYASALTPRIKGQIVTSLGERFDNLSLLRIVNVESDVAVRNTAIATLGRLPDARPQLRLLYGQARPESRIRARYTRGHGAPPGTNWKPHHAKLHASPAHPLQRAHRVDESSTPGMRAPSRTR